MTPTSGKGYFMDTPELMKLFIDRAYSLPAAGNTLYMDLEGVNLGRTGTITIIQVYIDSIKEMYFIDNSFMGDKVFRVFGAKSGKTFKDILEDQDIKKVIFACGNDISNMYHKHGIMCKGVFDVQIAKGGQRSYIYCVKADGGLSTVEAAAMAAVKAEGLAIYKTNNCRGPPDLKAFGRVSYPPSTVLF